MEVLDGYSAAPDALDSMPIDEENLMDTVSLLKAHFCFEPRETSTAGGARDDETQIDPFGS